MGKEFHEYVPSISHMGDCHICGHQADFPIHNKGKPSKMADNMIERVAMEIANWQDPHNWDRIIKRSPLDSRAHVAHYEAMARTVLKAMREIDGKMWSAGTKKFLDRYRCCEQQTTTEMFHAYADKSAEAILDAMIDAALKEDGNE